MPRRARAPRTHVPLVAALVLAGVFCTAVGFGQFLGLPGLSPLSGMGRASPATKVAEPTRISIPALGVYAAVVEVGLADDGSIATPVGDPAATAGWYGGGPSPGEPGTAVIVGHVDTASRPAVFHRLADLRPGALIEVSRHDHRAARFTVESVERYPKTSFPAHRISRDGPARLALVTCGGRWVGGDVGYADNVIVFARLA